MRLGTQIITLSAVDLDRNALAYGPIGITFREAQQTRPAYASASNPTSNYGHGS